MIRTATLLLLLLTALSTYADELFRRVQSVDELTENAEYIIAAMGYTSPRFYVCGTGMVGIDCGASPAEELSSTGGALIFSLIYEGEQIVLEHKEQFLCTKSGKNDLELSTQNYTPWRVTPRDGGFALLSGDKCLRINSYQSKASRFGLYSVNSQESTLLLYKRTMPVEQMQDYARFLKANTYETLILPFATALPDAQTKAYVVSRSGDELSYTEVSTLAAHTPYIIIRAKAGLIRLRADQAPSAEPFPHNALVGTLSPLRTSNALVLNGKEFVPAGPNCLVPAFRAYMTLDP